MKEIEIPNDLNLELVIRQLTEAVVVTNAGGEIIFFNDEAERLAELSKRKPERGTRYFRMAESEERRRMVVHTLNEVRHKLTQQTLEAEFKDAAGRSVFFEETYYPVLNDDGGLLQICIVAREITSRKIVERKTIQLVQDLSSLIENANAVIFGVDSRGYITDWNKECVRITQFEKNEVFAQKVDIIIGESSIAGFNALLKKVLEGNAVSNYECAFKTKNKPITALVNATPRTNVTGQVIGALLVGQDITELTDYRKSLEEKVNDRTEELKRALEKEKELVEMKRKFVSIASHEFKMPLASIGSSIDFIRANEQLRENDKEKLANIEKQVAHMKALLEDVLTIEKSEVTKLRANFQKIDLTGFLQKIAGEVEASTGNTHRVVSSFSHLFIELDSDEKLLRNIFINLLSNAIKFSPQREQIFLSVNLEDDKVQVVVRDEGIGIDEQDVERIFQPFNRGSNAGDIKGTGLGLSIVKKAVDTLSGKLRMESRIGAGTTFTITFRK